MLWYTHTTYLMPTEHIVENIRYYLLEVNDICCKNIYAYLFFDHWVGKTT